MATRKPPLNKRLLAVALGTLALAAFAVPLWQGRQTHPAGPPASYAEVMEATLPVSPTTPYVLVHAWATWCPSCVTETPALKAALPRLPATVTPVMLNRDSTEPLAFMAAHGLRGPAWHTDPDGHYARRFFTGDALPATVLLRVEPGSRFGVVQRWNGPVDWHTLPGFLTGL